MEQEGSEETHTWIGKKMSRTEEGIVIVDDQEEGVEIVDMVVRRSILFLAWPINNVTQQQESATLRRSLEICYQHFIADRS